MLDVAGLEARREPPLVFLNGGLSPYALSRQDAFTAEPVAGEALSGRPYELVLRNLPIPVIGVPWSQTSFFPDMPVVAHETGHTVESDFGLGDAVKRTIGQKVTAARSALWQQWSHEVFADLWGCLTLGPAFLGSLMDFLSLGAVIVENEIATETEKYPTSYLRILLCLKALGELGFYGERDDLEKLWSCEYRGGAMKDFERDIPAVVDAILRTPYAIGKKNHVLMDIPELRFTADDWKYAKMSGQDLAGGGQGESANTAPRLVAAARFQFETEPAGYRSAMFVERSKAIVSPGTRSGETLLNDAEKAQLSESSLDAGKKWFDEFAKWAGADFLPTGRNAQK